MNIKDLTTKIAANVVHVDRLAGAAESVALAITTRAASWLATIPTVILTSRSTQEIFGLTPTQAILASISLEVVGQAIVNTWMKAKDWNASRRANDPPANEAIGLAMSIVYFATDFILIGVLIVPQALVSPVYWAALLFPLAQVVSTVMTAERAAQFRRETTTEMDAADRKAKRQAKRQADFAHTSSEMSNRASNTENWTDSLTFARQSRRKKLDTRLDTLLTFYLDNPDAGPTEASAALDVSRQTIYSYQDALEQAGRLRKNGNGWEVMD